MTYCEECDNCLRPSESSPPYRWLCIKHKRTQNDGFVTKDMWEKSPPYLRCIDVNGGACPLFEPKRKPGE